MTPLLSGPEKRRGKSPTGAFPAVAGTREKRVGAALDHNISANPDNQLGQNESDRTQSPQKAKARIRKLTPAFFPLPSSKVNCC